MSFLGYGEVMLRLTPKEKMRLVQTNDFSVSFAGSEANTCVALSNLDIETSYFTFLPANEIGYAARNDIRRYGVDTKHIVFDDKRMGVIYIEEGYSNRPSKVIYDRAYSSFAMQESIKNQVKEILNGKTWFHSSGITAAISPDNLKLLLQEAKQKDIKTSFDLNYRNKLWTKEEARSLVKFLVKDVDVLIGNESDYSDFFEAIGEIDYTDTSLDYYKNIGDYMNKEYGINVCAFSRRESISANKNIWSGCLYYNGTVYESRKYELDIIDRVGAGDSFGAGTIYGLMNNYEPQKVIDFAVALSNIKHTTKFDYSLTTKEEAMALLRGESSGRIQR